MDTMDTIHRSVTLEETQEAAILMTRLETELLRKQVAMEQLKTAKSQTTGVQYASLPHRVYGVSELSHDGASWVAVLQLANDTKLVGRGDSPSKALNDFDEQWLGVK